MDLLTPPAPPRLNEPAPEFEANSTQGTVKLADYRGRWLVLFSHPADFTPVCTTEFLAFARNHDDFKSQRCDLLGLSVDSVTSHIAWLRNIHDKFGVVVPFPVVDDVGMRVAQRYGMIHPGASSTATVRSVFVIDDKGILRASLQYPLTTGRNVEEILRLVRALQVTDKHGLSTPEGWQPGDDVMVPPPQTTQEAEKRLAQGYDCADWYFCKKPIPETRRELPAQRGNL